MEGQEKSPQEEVRIIAEESATRRSIIRFRGRKAN
jgi:hypothetical protein